MNYIQETHYYRMKRLEIIDRNDNQLFMSVVDLILEAFDDSKYAADLAQIASCKDKEAYEMYEAIEDFAIYAFAEKLVHQLFTADDEIYNIIADELEKIIKM